MMLQTTLFVAAGGAVGTTLRYGIGIWLMPLSQHLPWSTILINIVGSFLIALFAALTAAHGRYGIPELWRDTFMIGVCGGFTTFSSFSLQTLDLMRAGTPMRALINIGLSVSLCIAAAAIGYAVAESFNRASDRSTEIIVERNTG